MAQEPRWEGFGIRLGRAISRWHGGGQRAFAKALETYKKESGEQIPVSYRTLLNYLSETTHPSLAWVEAAAAILRWNPENLLTGEGPEREGGSLEGLVFQPQHAGQERAQAIVQYLRREHADMAIGAQWMLLRFIDDYFGDRGEEWGQDDNGDAARALEVLHSTFGPLLSRPKMDYYETMALAASLTSAAYLRLAADKGA